MRKLVGTGERRNTLARHGELDPERVSVRGPEGAVGDVLGCLWKAETVVGRSLFKADIDEVRRTLTGMRLGVLAGVQAAGIAGDRASTLRLRERRESARGT
jgi:hypothetical protein